MSKLQCPRCGKSDDFYTQDARVVMTASTVRDDGVEYDYWIDDVDLPDDQLKEAIPWLHCECGASWMSHADFMAERGTKEGAAI